jgi:hypothetical protein
MGRRRRFGVHFELQNRIKALWRISYEIQTNSGATREVLRPRASGFANAVPVERALPRPWDEVDLRGSRIWSLDFVGQLSSNSATRSDEALRQVRIAAASQGMWSLQFKPLDQTQAVYLKPIGFGISAPNAKPHRLKPYCIRAMAIDCGEAPGVYSSGWESVSVNTSKMKNQSLPTLFLLMVAT